MAVRSQAESGAEEEPAPVRQTLGTRKQRGRSDHDDAELLIFAKPVDTFVFENTAHASDYDMRRSISKMRSTMGEAKRWQFWIDVGGTFTDCIARLPSGAVRTHKLLSSGVYKGAVGDGSGRGVIVDRARCVDPERFFDGWWITVRAGGTEGEPPGQGVGRQGLGTWGESSMGWATEATVKVRRFEAGAGRIVLDEPLPFQPQVGDTYELHCGEEAPVIGIRWLMGKRLEEPIGPVEVRLGTTRGTNALLERQGARVAFVTTAGFADVLRIAYQNRPELFALQVRKARQLYEAVVELTERLDKDGRVLLPLDEADAERKLREVHRRGIRSLAVCLLHAYRNPIHERAVQRLARRIGFEHVSVSSAVSPLQKIVSRGDTTVVDAYLTPILRDYVRCIVARIPDGTLKMMSSAGALVDADRFVGKDSVFSGPAGGVVGYAHVAQRAGFKRAIGFDMGGTSTDVSRFGGEYERRYETEVNDPESGTGVRIVAPMLAIETVAAGGGSICWFDGQKPVVGPRSAGADPGPACYGRDGPLTVTDVNLYLGKILPEYFPFPLDRAAVQGRLDELIGQIERATGRRYTREELAAGFTAIANANMIAPIKKVSIARGYDVRDYVLVTFGGAGGQHACAIAAELGISRILLHPLGGVLSAYGIGMADVRRFAEVAVGRPLGQLIEEAGSVEAALQAELAPMHKRLRAEVLAEGIPLERIEPPRLLLELRYHGQDSTISVPQPPDGNWQAAFERMHRQLYGFTFPERPVELYAARMELVGRMPKPPERPRPARPYWASTDRHTRTYFNGCWQRTQVFLRDELQPGARIRGPAIVIEPISTIVIEPGWMAELTRYNDILLRRIEEPAKLGREVQAPEGSYADQPAQSNERSEREPPPDTRQQEKQHQPSLQIAPTEPDPIMLELFHNHFASVAEQMGATLQKTALSTNVKERLDFSCAIFTADGDLVANAPHIPVHLGAMSESVKQLLKDVPAMQPGEVYVTNDPYRGGSHLPDVTVVTPVFEQPEEAQGARAGDRPRLLFFTASRAHHAEIGGITPGSMPPSSKNLAEEGVVIRHFRLVRDERSSQEELARLLSSGPYPSRAVGENLADINAQVAANQMGVNLLHEMIDRYGRQTVLAYMKHIQAAAERKMRSALLKIQPGRYAFTDQLDDGSPIRVAITVRHTERGGEATVDFTGTGPVVPGNLNANHAIVSSAVIYCFRCLIDEPVPLNAGMLAPIRIVLPVGCLLNPEPADEPARCPAVVGGNVETSQRIVDVIFGALGVVAASQGTMNNFTFGRPAGEGRAAIGYYETIGGGAGAGPEFDGADAVHTHMTNTRLTDPEVLEDRYPVRLRLFAIRRGSGGRGRQRGGDGIVRQIEFLEPLEVSLLTSRRTTRPYGLLGGEPGQPGRNLIIRRGSARAEQLGPTAFLRVAPGDVLRIETPGGGGYGSYEAQDESARQARRTDRSR